MKAAPGSSVAPTPHSAVDDPAQLTIFDIGRKTLPLRDGLQWLELPGETWEDIFYPPEENPT